MNEAKYERRGNLRAKAALFVTLLAPEERAGLITSSVSAGGLSMRIPDPPPLGTRLRMSVDLEVRPEPLIVSAEVVWVSADEGMIGALFTDLLVPDREVLEAIAIKHLLVTEPAITLPPPKK